MAKAAPKPASAFSFGAVSVKPPAASAGKAPEHFVSGTADVAALKHMRDLIDAAIEDVGGRIEADAMAYYLAEGCASKVKPANFTSKDGGHSATCILGKRRGNSVLSDDETALLDEQQIPYATENADDTYVFNTAALADPTIRSQIERALSKVELPVGTVLVERIPGAPKRTVTDETVAKVFQLDADKAELMLPIVTTFSLRSKWQVVANDLRPLVERVGKLLNLPGMAEKLSDMAERKKRRG